MNLELKKKEHNEFVAAKWKMCLIFLCCQCYVNLFLFHLFHRSNLQHKYQQCTLFCMTMVHRTKTLWWIPCNRRHLRTSSTPLPLKHVCYQHSIRLKLVFKRFGLTYESNEWNEKRKRRKIKIETRKVIELRMSSVYLFQSDESH